MACRTTIMVAMPAASIRACRPWRREGVARVLCLMLALVFPAFESFAQDDKKLTECALAQGDSADKVKQFYGIDVDPAKTAQPTPYRYVYHLEQYGIWVFFDEGMRVSSLRFDAPFRGRIGGVAIGDTADRLRSLRGEPNRQLSGLPDLAEQKKREQQVQALLKALPDPVPKSKVLATFADINRIRTVPLKFNTAWLYDPSEPGFVRYEIAPDDNRVQTILLRSCPPG
jgi:hypothetical protein